MLNHNCPEATLRSRRDYRASAFDPAELQLVGLSELTVDDPANCDLTGRHRPRSVFHGVGRELMQRKTNRLRRRCSQDNVGTFKHEARASGFGEESKLLANEVNKGYSEPILFHQQIMGAGKSLQALREALLEFGKRCC